jgi:hypothetical protein
MVNLRGSTVAATTGPEYAFNVSMLDFGTVVTGEFGVRQLTITHVGDEAGTYVLVLPSGMFAVSNDTRIQLWRTLRPSRSHGASAKSCRTPR